MLIQMFKLYLKVLTQRTCCHSDGPACGRNEETGTDCLHLGSLASRGAYAGERDAFCLPTWALRREVFVVCLGAFSVPTHLPPYGKHFALFPRVPSVRGCQEQLVALFLCFCWWLFWCAGFLLVMRQKKYWSPKDISSWLLRCPRVCVCVFFF